MCDICSLQVVIEYMDDVGGNCVHKLCLQKWITYNVKGLCVSKRFVVMTLIQYFDEQEKYVRIIFNQSA